MAQLTTDAIQTYVWLFSVARECSRSCVARALVRSGVRARARTRVAVHSQLARVLPYALVAQAHQA
eukprot:227322-Pleurochrysis_carterae.AAC.2